jgi:hypothetical protein
VGDYTYSLIHTFSYDGTYHGRLGTSRGFLSNPVGIAIKPGPLPFFSPSYLPSPPPPAGTPAVFSIELHDSGDEPIPNSYDMASDVFLYHAEAAYVDEDNGASVAIPCDVLYNENVPPTAALSVSCELTLATTYVCERIERPPPPVQPPTLPSSLTLLLPSLPRCRFTVSIVHSHKNPQNLAGSPHALTIGPASTDPGSCSIDVPAGKRIVAGASFEAIVKPFDEFQNPTSHAEDTFESRVELGSSGATVGNRQVLSADHAFSEQQKIAGA